MTRSATRRAGVATALGSAVMWAAVATGCAGCQMSQAGAQEPPPTTTRKTQAAAAVISFAQSQSTRLRPDAQLGVRVKDGQLMAVSARTTQGNTIPGLMGKDNGSWRSTGPLPPASRIVVTATARGADGAEVTRTTTLATLVPEDTERASITPITGSTVGIGMPIVVTFDHRVENRAAVERRLKVTAEPGVEGSWSWIDSHQVQYRPAEYWPAGTRVQVNADLAGVELADGIWGKDRKPVNFTVGRAMVHVVDIDRHTLTVKQDGNVLRTIPVTTGKPGLQTRRGVKVIMSQERTHRMDAATTGVKEDSPEYYNLVVDYAQRLTYSGEFFHAAPWSTWAQGRQNVSHGCTGMSTQDAQWLMHQAQVGDPVEFVGGSRALEDGNGWTLWNTSYDQWRRGSALQ